LLLKDKSKKKLRMIAIDQRVLHKSLILNNKSTIEIVQLVVFSALLVTGKFLDGDRFLWGLN